MDRPATPVARKLIGLALLVAAVLCAFLRHYAWDPAYKFTPFGGPWERLFGSLAVGSVLIGATLFLWRTARKSRQQDATHDEMKDDPPG